MKLTSRVRRLEAAAFGPRAWTYEDQEQCMMCMAHYEQTRCIPEGVDPRVAAVAQHVMETAKAMDDSMGGGHFDHWSPLPDEDDAGDCQGAD